MCLVEYKWKMCQLVQGHVLTALLVFSTLQWDWLVSGGWMCQCGTVGRGGWQKRLLGEWTYDTWYTSVNVLGGETDDEDTSARTDGGTVTCWCGGTLWSTPCFSSSSSSWNKWTSLSVNTQQFQCYVANSMSWPTMFTIRLLIQNLLLVIFLSHLLHLQCDGPLLLQQYHCPYSHTRSASW